MQGHKAAQLDTRLFSQTGGWTDRQTDKKTVRQVVWGKTGTLSSQFDSHAVPLCHGRLYTNISFPQTGIKTGGD